MDIWNARMGQVDLQEAYLALKVENKRLSKEIAHLRQQLTTSCSCRTDSSTFLHAAQIVPYSCHPPADTSAEIIHSSNHTSSSFLERRSNSEVFYDSKPNARDRKTHTSDLVLKKEWIKLVEAILGYNENEVDVGEKACKQVAQATTLHDVSALQADHLAMPSPMCYSKYHAGVQACRDVHCGWAQDGACPVEGDAEGVPPCERAGPPELVVVQTRKPRDLVALKRPLWEPEDICMLQKLERELHAMLAISQSAQKAKSAFLANISHEIRTPMVGILGAGTLLLDTPLNGEQAELAGMMVESSKLLLSIVNDILDVSKIDEGQLRIEMIPTDVNAILSHANRLFAPKAREKGIELHVAMVEEERRWILSDPTRLRQILLNLVGNAVKFTHKGKVTVTTTLCRPAAGPCQCSPSCVASMDTDASVTVRDGDGEPHAATCPCACSDTWALRVDIQDTGIGMSPLMVTRVFDRFHQADSSSTRLYGGSGLGTTISKELAKRMGGDVTVDSEEGKGSTFTVHLPVKMVVPPPPPASMMAEPVMPTSPRTPEYDAPKSYGLTAILAEDNNLNRCIMARLLRTLGIKVVAACNGQVVLDLVNSGVEHHLIFMDIQMPVCDGVAATKALRAQGYARPIVALTANVMECDLQRYLAAGMNDTLPKPCTRAQICQQVDRLMLSNALGSGPDGAAAMTAAAVAAAAMAPATVTAEETTVPVTAAASRPADIVPHTPLPCSVAKGAILIPLPDPECVRMVKRRSMADLAGMDGHGPNRRVASCTSLDVMV
eukprot:jgi/Mesvir1/21952/Mv10007-RA.3